MSGRQFLQVRHTSSHVHDLLAAAGEIVRLMLAFHVPGIDTRIRSHPGSGCGSVSPLYLQGEWLSMLF